MHRRTLVKAAGLTVAGVGLGGCTAARYGMAPGSAQRRFPVVRASWDRVIRTTVGLRPFRPAGFRVEAERVGDKTVIHNYGHGGAGMSLSWGTGRLAAELAEDHEARRAAVLGAGVVGLTTARELQSRGYEVVIYAASLPPDTTSNKSLAAFTPMSSLVSGPERTPRWDAQFDRAARIAYERLQLLAGQGTGISWVPTYSWTDRVQQPQTEGLYAAAPETLDVGATILEPGTHPFPARYARLQPTLRIEPSIYLDGLLRDVVLFGGEIVVRGLENRRDIAALDESLIFNCTGLGSRALFGDETLSPIKGQLTFLAPQPEIEYRAEGSAPGGGRIGVLPRSDGIAIGHLSQRDVWDLAPDPEARRVRVERAIALFSHMEGRTYRPPLVAAGDLPFGDVPPVESFYGLES